MFAYCSNNPIIRIDTSGEFFNTICGAVIGGAIAAITCGEGETPAQAFMRGAVTGAIAGAGLDLCIATGGIGGLIVVGITGAASGVIDTAWEKKNQGNDINWGEAVANGIIGAGLNVLFGAAGREAGNAVGKTLKEVGKAVVTNFKRSITNKAGKVVAKKAVQATLSNSAYSAVQGAAAKVYSLITAKMLKEAW